MEHWDVYDINRNLTGRSMERGGKPDGGEYRLTVHVCVFNQNEEMLIQKRQPFKEGWSGMWDVTAGGSALSGESSQQAAMRELYEEVGISVNLEGVRPHLSVSFFTGYDDIYLVEHEADTASLKLQYEEVEQVKWAAKEEILELIDNRLFIPYYKSVIELYFDMRKGYGKFVTDVRR